MQALSEGVAGVISTPVVLRDHGAAITNICAEYASWATLHGERPVELPYPDMQWRRLSIDVLAALAERLPVPVSAAFAWMAAMLKPRPTGMSTPAPMRSAACSRSSARFTHRHRGD